MLIYCQKQLVWMSGLLDFPKNRYFSSSLSCGCILCVFCYLLIKVNNFAFDRNPAFFGQKLLVYVCSYGYPENKAISAPTYNWGWVQFIFWCLLITVNSFTFDEEAVLWPETTCLDEWVGWWVVGFSENIAISGPN